MANSFQFPQLLFVGDFMSVLSFPPFMVLGLVNNSGSYYCTYVLEGKKGGDTPLAWNLIFLLSFLFFDLAWQKV